MRHVRSTLAAALFGSSMIVSPWAQAADLAQPQPAGATQKVSFLSELRLGVFAHDPWSPERGSVDVNAEALFAKPFDFSDQLASAFVPRPHIGATFNTRGDTSHAYVGLAWTFSLTERIFLEGALGGALNNGVAGPVTPVGRSAMGCHLGFREAASLGYRFTDAISLMATVEHISNAGACSDNRGLTNVGMRLGYSF